jgi:hypothetical protein
MSDLSVVERGVPMPPAKSERRPRIDLGLLPVGDYSMRVDFDRRGTLGMNIRRFTFSNPQAKFTTRVMTDDDGVKYIRVWRIA